MPHVRFFIALVPPQPIQDYASDVIQSLGDRYRTGVSKAPPHVTLQPPFEWDTLQQHTLEACLSDFVTQQRVVPVQLSGFGSFPPRVLYINVLKTPSLLHLQAALMATLETQLGIVDPKSKQRPFSPHLTVASRNVTRQTFKQAWEELRSRSVEFEWVSDRITLLIHTGHHWQVEREFPLVVNR
ncbi:2'-5' RNA ligase family protein [Oscillatoria sp. FACHB-1407]|uniref:2'-5' RNA ligase family protein n=1 Tax=Oscillatoria sp. FACHB-1407 TaxID=2692847 RepID=UPI0016845CD2|nr:2'-5' RNA ligase family protein [Oscillatoria sp. FACHB-1407]MBD2461357.1 2'-5' RNA ligase family protein [Oscillatoria sp. FACHB-1407]